MEPLELIPIGQKYLTLLMSRPKIPWKLGQKKLDLDPEEKICVDFADTMRDLTARGVYAGLWFHVPNEGKRHIVTTIIMRAMGLIPGVFDYVFIWRLRAGVGFGVLFLEFKYGSNTLSEYQRYFRYWLDKIGVPNETVRTKDAALSALKKYGAL